MRVLEEPHPFVKQTNCNAIFPVGHHINHRVHDNREPIDDVTKNVSRRPLVIFIKLEKWN